MKALTLKQGKKLGLIQTYLRNNEIGKEHGIFIDSDITNVYVITDIYYNAVGINLIGKCSLFRPVKDRMFENKDINQIFTACKKDDDFNYWLNHR